MASKTKVGGIEAILATGQFPGVHVRGTTKGNHANIHVKPEHCAPNPRYLSDGITAGESEKRDARMIESRRKAALKAKRMRRLTRRADDEIQLEAAVPYALHAAARKETGNNNIWKEEGGRLLKKYGLDFGT